MKILYVANHDQPNADDEGAITFALTQLGHDVQRLRESKGLSGTRIKGVDLVLVHHLKNLEVLRAWEGRARRAFWCFDLIDWPGDETLRPRCERRKRWMAEILPLVELGFCTDGDWVDFVEDGGPAALPWAAGRGKLHWLMQGADERLVGMVEGGERTIDILLTGIGRGGGVQRESFVAELTQRYGRRFCHVSKGTYREQLRELIGSTQVVVAPDSPVTDRYWSNRVYNALGFGALLLHPQTFGLREHYTHSRHCFFYDERRELHCYLDHLLAGKSPQASEEMRVAAVEHTRAHHTYRHRCQQLLEVVQRCL